MSNKWNVYLDGKWIDAVFYSEGIDKDYVRESLINHDGYDPNIKVVKARELKPINVSASKDGRRAHRRSRPRKRF